MAMAVDETCSRIFVQIHANSCPLRPRVDIHRQPSPYLLPPVFLFSAHSFERAAQQGKTDAKFMLGSCYFEGSGCQQDKKLGKLVPTLVQCNISPFDATHTRWPHLNLSSPRLNIPYRFTMPPTPTQGYAGGTSLRSTATRQHKSAWASRTCMVKVAVAR